MNKKKIEKSRKASIRKMFDLNIQEIINKMTEYYEVLDMFNPNLSPVLLAIDKVNEWKKHGLINKFGELNSQI